MRAKPVRGYHANGAALNNLMFTQLPSWTPRD